ncbi:hypothetical protein FHG87_007375 [Trinorchestia longiramus]|nr:hypothetical protein FHG87_007375 [Trinorchestia longiramus]
MLCTGDAVMNCYVRCICAPCARLDQTALFVQDSTKLHRLCKTRPNCTVCARLDQTALFVQDSTKLHCLCETRPNCTVCARLDQTAPFVQDSTKLHCFVLVVVMHMPAVEGFADGAPVEACIFKGPNHAGTKSQPLDTFPYDFVADAGSFKGGEKINGKKLSS